MSDSLHLFPVPPTLTDLYLRELVRDSVPKPTALGTPARYSDAGSCGRAIGYAALGVTPTNPMDVPGHWVTNIGTLLHEKVQEAIGRKYPEAEFEVPTKLGDHISGSCDGYLDEAPLVATNPDWTWGSVVFELKTMGAYGYDKQIGLKRRARKMDEPEGPKYQAILQAGLNALGLIESGKPVDSLVMGSASMEAVSIQLAESAGIDDTTRVMAEFVIPDGVWRGPAMVEKERITRIVESVNENILPDRSVVVDLSGNLDYIDPDASRPAWQCTYCKFKDRCLQDRSELTVPVELRK